MSLGKRLIGVGAAACTTDTADVFGDSSGVALYTLDYDASDAGGQFDGTPTDVEFGVGGQINYGARFNGTSSIIQDVLGSGFTYAGKTMTFSAWIYVTDNTKDNVIIGDSLTFSGGWGIATGYGTAPNQRLSFSMGRSGGVEQTYSSVSIADNTWTHIAVSVNFGALATNSSIKMYINGTEDTSLTDGITTAFVENTLYNSSIGGTWNGSAGRLFAGSIDQVRIFNRALNSTEVSTLYAETACVYTCTTDTVDYPTTNVAYYKLDNSATDETGSYDGTETNISYTFGRFGQAAVFNGSSSYIDLPLTSLFGAKNTNTVSLWFKTSTTAYGDMFSDYAQNSFNNSIGINANGTLRFQSRYSGSDYFYTTTGTYNDDIWHNLVSVVNVSTNSKDIYIDGSFITNVTLGGTWNGDATQKVTIGAAYITYLSSYYNYFTGDIDQVRIFDTELDGDQIFKLYAEGIRETGL